MTASADNILLRGMGDVTLEGRSVNVTAASGITLHSQEVRTYLRNLHVNDNAAF